MEVGKYEIVTREYYFFGYSVKMTQRYLKKHDFGHYSYVVSSLGGTEKFILSAGQTSGGAPKGKIDQKMAHRHYEQAVENWEDFVAHEENEKK